MATNYCPNRGQPVNGENYCKNCGERIQSFSQDAQQDHGNQITEGKWNYDMAQSNLNGQEVGEQSSEKRIPTIVWVIMWFFCAPVPISILLLRLMRNKGVKPAIRKTIIAALWLFAIIMVFSTESKVETDKENVPVHASTDAIEEPQSFSQSERQSENFLTNTETALASDDRFSRLAADKEKYLLFLRILGDTYDDMYSMDAELYDEWQMLADKDYETYMLLYSMFRYRVIVGQMPPNFSDSFANFWSSDISENYSDVKDSLKQAFDIEYRFDDNSGKFVPILKENEATAAFWASQAEEMKARQNSISNNDDYDWLDAEGNVFFGVQLYRVTDAGHVATLYATCIDDWEDNVYLLLAESGEVQLHNSNEELLLTSVKVRSDDPYLPDNEDNQAVEQIYLIDGIEYYDFENHIEKGTVIYLKNGDTAYPYFEVMDFGSNKRNDDGWLIKNAILVQDIDNPDDPLLHELYLLTGREPYWKDLDDMIENNQSTKEEGNPPVYYVRVKN